MNDEVYGSPVPIVLVTQSIVPLVPGNEWIWPVPNSPVNYSRSEE